MTSLSSSASSRSPPPSAPRPSVLARFVPTLTTTSHISALVFSSFLIVHLGAPLASTLRLGLNTLTSSTATGAGASAGCTEAASRWQLLGRVYYQGALSEPVVVWGAALLHVLSSVAKRGIMVYLARKRRRTEQAILAGEDASAGISSEEPLLPAPAHATSSSPKGAPRWFSFSSSLPSSHTLSAYALLPLLLSHLTLHRLRPLSSSYPINSLSPSELDYSFVHFGATLYPHLYTTSMVALTAVAAYHVAGGAGIIGRRWGLKYKARKAAAAARLGESDVTTRQTSKKKRKRGPLVPALVGSALVLLGFWGIVRDEEAGSHLFTKSGGGMAGEGQGVGLTWVGKRMDAVYKTVWPFSWT
ncbi:hypothetical protein BCV69DRAFT_220550 [Microstroma glucosiphilum]|uniref:Mitochondrial adapter protein MCP1 transmembrane domain-containing protein n=1 Tax=Pseudomicrostroma glucosiphilum TaxID=1684307 RepID=A0A316U5L5_9BASI|nr:hypothetical protein BCV69DRAFT_220550 [Pseudomicrostroma glucosiphilum]PWN20128.1 hypothetical protein BCV69DRAFT_220550 [Pseudomicrostroma glucosiphilum]